MNDVNLSEASLSVLYVPDTEPTYSVDLFSADRSGIKKQIGPFTEESLRSFLGQKGIPPKEVDCWIAGAWNKFAHTTITVLPDGRLELSSHSGHALSPDEAVVKLIELGNDREIAMDLIKRARKWVS